MADVRRPHVYTREEVDRLLGLKEDLRSDGRRDVTVLDLISWARDPGGDLVLQSLHRLDTDAWMARRGPLAPHSEEAATLFDFLRAMKKMDLVKQAVLALHVMGFDATEIGALLDPSQVIDLSHGSARRKVSARRKSALRMVRGRPLRDSTGAELRCELGHPVMVGRLAEELTELMNGGQA
jgi:hypothetical protein